MGHGWERGVYSNIKIIIIQDRLNRIMNELQLVESQSDIDSNLCCFYDIIDDVCSPAFKKKINNKKSNLYNTHTHSKNQQWFDSECNEQQKQFYTFLHDYRREKSELNRQNMVKSRSAYKQLIRKKKISL